MNGTYNYRIDPGNPGYEEVVEALRKEAEKIRTQNNLQG